MKDVVSRMGRSLLPFALGAVLFLTGCFGDPGNREACVSANSAPFACVGEEQGLILQRRIRFQSIGNGVLGVENADLGFLNRLHKAKRRCSIKTI